MSPNNRFHLWLQCAVVIALASCESDPKIVSIPITSDGLESIFVLDESFNLQYDTMHYYEDDVIKFTLQSGEKKIVMTFVQRDFDCTQELTEKIIDDERKGMILENPKCLNNMSIDIKSFEGIEVVYLKCNLFSTAFTCVSSNKIVNVDFYGFEDQPQNIFSLKKGIVPQSGSV